MRKISFLSTLNQLWNGGNDTNNSKEEEKKTEEAVQALKKESDKQVSAIVEAYSDYENETIDKGFVQTIVDGFSKFEKEEEAKNRTLNKVAQKAWDDAVARSKSANKKQSNKEKNESEREHEG